MTLNTSLQSKKTVVNAISKTALDAHYQVDRATLNKWLIIFCVDLFSDENYLLRRRKFSAVEVEEIKNRLGEKPQSFEKLDFVRLAETDYKTIRDNIKKYQSLYGNNDLS